MPQEMKYYLFINPNKLVSYVSNTFSAVSEIILQLIRTS